jgi:hypothetical protein
MKPVTPLFLLAALCATGCQPSSSPPDERTPVAPVAIDAPGLHNVYRVTDKLLSGSAPAGEEGLRSLRELGVRTMISVDGAAPDVELARRHGLRYVHLPIGYNGLPAVQGLRIARAVRDLPGLVYIHCHHGKHRGPAAAAIARLCLEPHCPVEAAVGWLRRAGTDPHYVGLYRSVERLRRPTAEELERVSGDFPEVADVPALAQAMVAVDATWDRLKTLHTAQWKVPPGHSDLDPPHEALQLREHYREALRLRDVERRPQEFRLLLEQAEQAAGDLEAALRPAQKGTVDHLAAETAFRRSGDACLRCHATFRDLTQPE